jgi:hypothetical protein
MSRNLLDQETSPYLLLHKDNPVHWRPWGADALAEAEAESKPILLSIGYTACHWCHVMNHESFADPETAALMNELFVNIKVDREERPDLDQIYQTAANALGQNGGWPLTAFLTPAGEPFAIGSYYPKDERLGRPAFKRVLEDVARIWREQPEPIANTGARVHEVYNALWGRNLSGPFDPVMLDTTAVHVGQRFDLFYGSMTGAPKFPLTGLTEFLWRAYLRSGTVQFDQLVQTTLVNECMGGIYDHVGGGFARYATDERWLVPHFEKMLYDNALLIDLLTLVWQGNRKPLYRARIEETVGWVLREMTVEHAFLAGTFAQRFKQTYNVSREGAFEGRNILHRLGPNSTYPLAEADEALLKKQRELLLAARAKRVAPARDDKVLADWNGLTIAALVRASAVFGEPAWIATARAAFDFVMGKLRGGDGRLLHAWREGHPGARALIDDYASMARAALALFEASGEPRDLDAARSLADEALDLFGDGAGGVYLTAKDAADVPGARPRQAHDGASPSGVGLLAEVFVRLWHLTDEPRWREAAENLIRAVSGAPEGLGGSPLTLMSADMLERGGSVVIDGPLDDPRAQALAEAALGAPDPSLTVLRLDRRLWPDGSPRADLPRAQEPIAMLCQGQNCSLPVTTPEALIEVIEARRVASAA